MTTSQTDQLDTRLASLSQASLTCAPAALAVATCPPPGSQVPVPAPPRIEPVVTVSPPPPPVIKCRPRTGAVAALPKDERDMVCRMIANGVPYSRIVEALDHLGFVITERNVSNWVTHGGYAEWAALYEEGLQTSLRQDDLLEHHRHQNSPDLAEVGLQAAATRLSESLLRQTASQQGNEANVSTLEPAVNLLCRINKELFALQKYRDDCQRTICCDPNRIKEKQLNQLILVEEVYSTERPQHKPGAAPAANSAPASPASTTPQSPAAATAAAQSSPATTPAPAQSSAGTAHNPEAAPTPPAAAPLPPAPPPTAPANTPPPVPAADPGPPKVTSGNSR